MIEDVKYFMNVFGLEFRLEIDDALEAVLLDVLVFSLKHVSDSLHALVVLGRVRNRSVVKVISSRYGLAGLKLCDPLMSGLKSRKALSRISGINPLRKSGISGVSIKTGNELWFT